MAKGIEDATPAPAAPWNPAPPGMPPIFPHILDIVLYVYPSLEAADQGKRAGGSGFLVQVPLPDVPIRAAFYAVTNRHVVAQSLHEGGCPAIRLSNQRGEFDVIPVPAAGWVDHPAGDDLAIAPIGLSPDYHKFESLPSISLLGPDDTYRFAPGTETAVIGRFITHEGKQRNTLAVRFGNVAMLPHEPVLTDRGLQQESFLVEARSLPGYSGSPVFVLTPSPQGTSAKLLGVDYGHLRDFAPVLADDKETRSQPPMWCGRTGA